VDEVTIRDLRNHAGDLVYRVEHGETVIITRAGQPVAEMRPLPKPRLNVRALLNRWKDVPAIDLASLRTDIDSVIDPSL
jgi:antitoxin (DNA-binding transcriptional repressor) of toxin-antitoxin stability system